jgi:hypothetical protein
MLKNMGHVMHIANAAGRAVLGAFAGAVLGLCVLGIVLFVIFDVSCAPFRGDGPGLLLIGAGVGAGVGVVTGVWAGAWVLRGKVKAVVVGILAGAVLGTLAGVLYGSVVAARAGGEIVVHLRGPGPHVRGCWCVDLLPAGSDQMTESEWDACNKPTPMLRFLLGTDHPRVTDVEAFPNCKASARKLRLFACACYARLRQKLPSSQSQAAVEVAERFADDLATPEELWQADTSLRTSLDALEGPWRASRGEERAALLPMHEALALAFQVTWPEAPKAAYYASSNAYLAAAALTNPGAASYSSDFATSRAEEERAQAYLLRDIVGPLPFRKVRLDPTLLDHSDSLLVKLAQAAYDNRLLPDYLLDPARLTVLGDALEEVDADADLVAHLRSPLPHVRGCWAIDLLLRKECPP